ncbi:MAG: type II toxin-antitoxin system VapC family toxin [Nanoarchaeota archaeon]
MVKEICLDTDVIIDILKSNARAQHLAKNLGAYEVYTTTANIFELFLRKTNKDTLESFVSAFHVLPFNYECARLASEIALSLDLKGRPVDFRDIFIASICIQNKLPLATFNTKHFSQIPGLKLV